MYNSYQGLSGFDLSRTDDLSTLWEELDLKGLVDANAANVTLISEQAKQQRTKAKKSGFQSLADVYKAPAFETLRKRYHTTPRPPSFCTPEFIEKLADPVKGRHKNVDLVRGPDNQHEYVLSPSKDTEIRSSSFNLKAKKSSAPSFFLTGEEEYDNNEDSDVSLERRLNKEGASAMKPVQKKNLKIKPSIAVNLRQQPPAGLLKTKNTKTNAALFREKYLPPPGKPSKIKSKKPASKSWKSAAGKSGNVKRDIKSKYLNPEWTLRPEESKPRAPKKRVELPSRLQSVAVPAVKTRAKTKEPAAKQVPCHISRKMDRSNQDISDAVDSMLRSKSSADIRRMKPSMQPAHSSTSIKPLDELPKKPSSTSNILDKGNPRNSITKLPKVVLSPIKPMKPKEPDVSDVIEANYKKMKKQFGIDPSRPISASSRAKIDENISAAIKKAETINPGGVSNTGAAASNPSFLLNQYAKKLSAQFSRIDENKAKYKALAEDLE